MAKSIYDSMLRFFNYKPADNLDDADTPIDIFLCAEQGDVEGLQSCLIFNDDINALKDGKTALFYSTDIVFAKWLIHFGIHVDHVDENGMTAVHAAINAGERELAEYLIRVSKRPEWESLTVDRIYRLCERDILRRCAYAVLEQRERQLPVVCQ